MADRIESMWQVVWMLTVLTLVGLGTAYVFAPKRVDGYYLSRGTTASSQATCAYAHWTWHADEIAFCTNSYQEAVDFVSKANASLHREPTQ